MPAENLRPRPFQRKARIDFRPAVKPLPEEITVAMEISGFILQLYLMFALAVLSVPGLVGLQLPSWFSKTSTAFYSMDVASFVSILNSDILLDALFTILQLAKHCYLKLVDPTVQSLEINCARVFGKKRSTCLFFLAKAVLLSVLISRFIPLVSASPVAVTASLAPRDLTNPSNAELLRNTIGFGAFAVVTFILRLVNKMFIEHKFQYEDYCMSVAMAAYLSEMTLINVSGYYQTNLYEPADAPGIFADPRNVEMRIKGSKIVIGLEQSMLVVTWMVKLCIWFFLMRVCQGVRKYELALWALLAYIGVGYIAVMVTYYGLVCRPFSQYWAMPVQNPECATYHKYSVVQMTFNISSDIALFTLPLVLVLNTRTSWQKKSVLLIPFSLGFATILCAILNKYYNFSSPQTTVYALWYIREASIAIAVGNLICTWKLIKKIAHLPNLNLIFKRTEVVIGRQQQIAMPHVLNGALYRDGERVGRKFRDLYSTVMGTKEEGTVAGRSHVNGEASTSSGRLNNKSSTTMVESGDEINTGPAVNTGEVVCVRHRKPLDIVHDSVMTAKDAGGEDATPALKFQSDSYIV